MTVDDTPDPEEPAGIGLIKTAKVHFDGARLAAAFRNRPAPMRLARKPLHPALSIEPCPRCGISGARGCDHQTPFDGQRPAFPSRCGPRSGHPG